MPRNHEQAAIHAVVGDLRRIESRLAALSQPLPEPSEDFELLAELRSGLDSVQSDLLVDAIETLERLATSDEAALRLAFVQRRQLLRGRVR